MESFHWGGNFETGLTEVDKQHHQLVDIINRFGELLAENVLRIRDVDTLYHQLADYAVYHFDEEEKLMDEVKVDELHTNHHIDMHKSFLEDVSSIYSTISLDNLDQAHMFLKYLIHWLAYHILGEDMDMANQIKAIQSGRDPREAYQKLETERDPATAPLIDALSGLFEQMSLRNKELKQLNDSLEEKVALRTKELTTANQHLEELSLTDTLTGLPNRRQAMRRLSTHWDEALRTKAPLICMMIDADHFKEVNDLYGHDAGDNVLVKLAMTLQDSLRNDDIVCRLGGDEFLIICPNTDLAGGMHIAELVRKTVSELRVPTGGEPWIGSISIGVASKSTHMKSFEELIRRADRGLYLAKEAGKNCVKNLA
jgi:hemerythrin